MSMKFQSSRMRKNSEKAAETCDAQNVLDV
jgi:hypothetical protein